MYGRISKHNSWPDLTLENRRNYLIIEALTFWFYEKSFSKLVFDLFFQEFSMCLLIGLKIFKVKFEYFFF